jgi:hypothetical protein
MRVKLREAATRTTTIEARRAVVERFRVAAAQRTRATPTTGKARIGIRYPIPAVAIEMWTRR